ncbi:MAG: CHC2 zinc finger domain-containing protein, partial [Patescibacteria group bacterium]
MDQKDEIKQKLDIVDVVGSYVPLKKSGRNYKAVCPFHSEKTPSFMVSPELQIYKCFGCGVSGDIYSFVQEIEGVDFSRAIEILAERAGVKLIRRVPDTQAEI